MDDDVKAIYDALMNFVQQHSLARMTDKSLSALMKDMVAMRIFCTDGFPEELQAFLPCYKKVFIELLRRRIPFPSLPVAFDGAGNIVCGKEELFWLFNFFEPEKSLELLQDILEQFPPYAKQSILSVAFGGLYCGAC